jgi:3-phenylpropionate/trans-cinnamate dioxygenase ferredoxin reductase subunit
VRPADFYRAHGIDTRFGEPVARVHAASRTIELADGEHLPYDRVLIATGGRNRTPAIPGFELDGVHQLRTVGDADRIRAEAAPGRAAVVVGMGFVGAEVAASLRALGVRVVAIEHSPTPLFRTLGGQVGNVLADLHREHGVSLHLGESVAALEGAGRVEAVTTGSGRRFDCDFVVLGVGIEPLTDLVTGSGVLVDNGIVVDEHCRTSVEGIYAAGDVANHYHPLWKRHIRVEHWQNALKHGQAAARSMLGKHDPYAEIPWFWSDQYDVNIQYVGFHTEWDRFVVRGSLARRDFVGFYLLDDRVEAAIAMNRGRDLRRATAIVRARMPVDAARLQDETLDLRTLTASVAPA